jgi:predicted Zn-dependent peptidase
LQERVVRMSNIKEIKNELLNDSYYEIDHSSGYKIFVYPKENYSSSYAIFGTKYGSIDTCFKVEGQANFTEVPEGIAHFLEHKLFESEELDAFARYAKTGASANAYTSFDKTCYLFSCTDNFEDSLEILFDFVQNPYFTEQTVQKEQGIIGQEIRMYEDEPGWESLFVLLRAMYHKHPVRIDIAGTVESISEITADLLYECYNTFYNPANMALAVAGNVTVEQVLKVADKMLKPNESRKIERKFQEEPAGVVEKTAVKNLSVSMPIFAIGFKEEIKTPCRTLKESVESNLLLDIIAGKTSSLYEKLLGEGLINTTFDTEYFEGYGYSAHIFSGESHEYEKVREYINEELARVIKDGVNKEDFDRIKKKHYGNFIMNFNDIDSISNSLIGSYFNGEGLFEQLSVLESVTLEDVNNRLRNAIDIENSSMSVIKQK